MKDVKCLTASMKAPSFSGLEANGLKDGGAGRGRLLVPLEPTGR